MTVETGAPAVRTGRFAYHLGEVVPMELAALPLTTQGLHYGTGVFEGIRAFRRPGTRQLNIFRAADHFDRFLRSARLLHLEIPPTAAELTRIATGLLRENGQVSDVYMRPLAYKLGLLPGTPPGVGLRGVSTAVSIIVHALPEYHPAAGIRCHVASWRRPSAASVPVQAKLTGGYVNCALAVDEARSAGYDDAILLNERGEVAEASTANVFAVIQGRVVTPPASAGILLGITRDTVLTLARDLRLDTCERALDLADLLLADEVFLTGTGVGVVPVVGIAGRCFGGGRPGPLAAAIADRYESAVRGQDPRYAHWLTPVEIG